MNNLEKKNNLPKIYQIAGLTAFIYSTILIVFFVYKQFFYIDGTWEHGLTVNSFSVLSSLMWIGILFVFKSFMNKILNFSKANLLINIYLLLLAITTIILATVLYKSIKLYISIEDIASLNSAFSFATSSLSGGIFILISSIAIALICMFLGNKIRKVDVVEKKTFQILGFLLIVYGIFSLLVFVTIIENDNLQNLIKAVLSALIGVILYRVYKMDFSDLCSLVESKNVSNSTLTKPKAQKKENHKTNEINTKKDSFFKKKKKETILETEEVPTINLDEIEDKSLVLSYYENLSEEEKNRLETIVTTKYNQSLTNEQKTNLVIQHIAKNRVYDHQRFIPK